MRTTADLIIAEALTWLNTPYHHAARVKGAGVDCAQLLVGVYVDALALVPPFDISHYPPDWMKHREEERFLSYIEQRAVEVDLPAPGDIALWQWGRCFAHGGIVLDWPQILHADVRTGRVTITDASQGRFHDRCVRFFRVQASAQGGAA